MYNAAAAAIAAAAANQNPVLLVSGQQLSPLCHNQLQQTVLALPGRDVSFVRGAITPQQLGTHRQSYVNAVLIQRAGVLIPRGCSECQRRGLRPFPKCRRIVGHFGGACGNCKWRDHGARCVVRHGDEADEAGDSDGSSEPEEIPRPIGDDGRRQRLLTQGDAGNPIVL